MKKKKQRERVENMWMMWLLKWFNRSVVTINAAFQLLNILLVDPQDAQENLI